MSEYLADIRSRIEALGLDFQFKGTIKTSGNGMERETWLLEYEGSRFVFVAGQKHVTLGWNTDQCPLGEGVLKGLQEEFEAGHAFYQEELEVLETDYQRQIQKAKEENDSLKAEELISEQEEEIECLKEEMSEKGYTTWEDFMAKWNEHLSQYLSPLRTADIGDMLVEADSRYLEEDMPSLAEAVSSLKEGPFTLATEDEWEYLCNGGTRTLFRWGDVLDHVLTEIFQVGCVSETDEGAESILNRSNMLGLSIAYDSYKIEIIDSTQYTKGGDGGRSLCGGDGAIFVLPCYTAFYRQMTDKQENTLSKHYYSYRRIVRLPK